MQQSSKVYNKNINVLCKIVAENPPNLRFGGNPVQVGSLPMQEGFC